MTRSIAAKEEFRRVQEVVIPDLRKRAMARFGREELAERQELGKTQQKAADDLGVVVEQVRRYEAAWRQWQKAHPGEEP
jgi:hypothetical protein